MIALFAFALSTPALMAGTRVVVLGPPDAAAILEAGLSQEEKIEVVTRADLLAGAKNPWTGNNETGVIEPEKLGSSGGKGTSWFPGEATARKWAEIRGVSTQ